MIQQGIRLFFHMAHLAKKPYGLHYHLPYLHSQYFNIITFNHEKNQHSQQNITTIQEIRDILV